jgi:hypothetical protein
MHKDDLPNLFIIGAPKCGTTSMFRWLAAHPAVCASHPKETYFFADRELDYIQVPVHHRKGSLSDYLKLFPDPSPTTRAKMEGSTHYLYSRPALNFIAESVPTAKIIVHIRKPSARIWSHFQYIKQKSKHPITIRFTDYVDCLLAGESRSKTRFANDPWSQHLLDNQILYSSYYRYLRLWMERLPADQVKILVLESIVDRKYETVTDLANWIGIDPNFYDDLQLQTANVAQTRQTKLIRDNLARLAKYFPRSARSPARTIVDFALRPSKVKISEADRKALNNLDDYFAGPNERLKRELQLDLSRWTT